MSFPLWAAAVLVGAEYFLFSLAFDSAEFRQRADLWALAGYLGSMAVLVPAAVMGVIISGEASHQGRPLLHVARRLDAFALIALVSHAASAAVLWWLTARVLSPSGPPSGPAVVWLSLWFVAALATPLFCGAASFPAIRALRGLVSSPALVGGLLLGLGAWLAGQGSTLLWEPLGPWTLWAVERTLHLLLDYTYYDPARFLIGSDRFLVEVNRQCSGFEGVGLMTVFVVAYILLARRELRFPQALLLLPLGIAASVAANVVRIVALVLVGTFVSESIAVSGFHARAGWLFFCVLVFSLLLLSSRLSFFALSPSASSFSHPTAAYLMPFLALVGVAMLSGLATANVDRLYILRIVAAVVALQAFRHYYDDLKGPLSWTAVATGFVAGIAFIALSPRPDGDRMQAWQEEWSAMSSLEQFTWLAVRVLGSVLVVPLAEELAFRGYALRRLIAREFETVSPRDASLAALLVSSVAFGAIHVGWIAGSVAGLLFGLVQIQGNGIRHAVIAHVVSNAVVALSVLGFGQWWLWM